MLSKCITRMSTVDRWKLKVPSNYKCWYDTHSHWSFKRRVAQGGAAIQRAGVDEIRWSSFMTNAGWLASIDVFWRCAIRVSRRFTNNTIVYKANILLLTHVSLSNIPYKLTLWYVNDTSLAYIQVFAKTEAEFIISWMPCLLGLQMQFIGYRAVTLSVPWPFKRNERQIWSLIFKNCRCSSIAYTCTWALELRW